MWTWASWVRGKGQDEEKAETAKQPDMAEGQRQPRTTGNYQRNKAEQLSPKASETVGMVKPPGGARREGGTPHSQKQVEDAELGEDWHEDLKKLQVALVYRNATEKMVMGTFTRKATTVCTAVL